MATQRVTLTATVRLAWWLRLHLYGVALVSHITGLEPDWDKLRAKLERGMTVRIDVADAAGSETEGEGEGKSPAGPGS